MYYIHEKENGYPLFYCDTQSDVVNLPTSTKKGVKEQALYEGHDDMCPIGSHAFCTDTQSVVTLNTDDAWV